MGLAVDYGAHITHYFMTTDGADRNKRVETTLIDMGPAVLNGGFSTFLAFILLITSKWVSIEMIPTYITLSEVSI